MIAAKMDISPGTCEIVEFVEEIDNFSENARQHHMLKSGKRCLLEDDLNQLFEAVEIRKSVKGLGRQLSKDALQKTAMKKPIKGNPSRASGIGISEPVSLKQALRGLCISQASEMAAMKRLSRSAASPGPSESGTIKKLYRTVVVDASQSGLSLYGGEENMVEISLVPETNVQKISGNMLESKQAPEVERANQTSHSSTLSEDASTKKPKVSKTSPQHDMDPLPTGVRCEISEAESKHNGKLKSLQSSSSTCPSQEFAALDDIVPASAEILSKSLRPAKEQKSISHSANSFNGGNKAVRSASTMPPLIRPALRNKTIVKRKINQNSVAASSSSCSNGEVAGDLGASVSDMVCESPNCTLEDKGKAKEKVSLASNVTVEVSSGATDSGSIRPDSSSKSSGQTKTLATHPDTSSVSREKGVFSHSSKSSIGEFSTSTSISDESNTSGSSCSGHRPHMSKDLRWEAISAVRKQHRSLGLRHFKLLNKLGSGDIGTVYLAELIGTNCVFALKVMDNEFLVSRKKMARAQTEKEILQMLDHPFLPTLFAHFTTNKFLCLVMEYCPGGDLHVLRQKQPSKSYSEQAARFYVAEVLLALEYLHMLGVVYRDLKPENVLVREDGHIMLSDFDLSLRCAVHPTLVKSSPPVAESAKKISSHCTESNCIEPFCLHPSWQVPCFTPRLLSGAAKSRKLKSELASQVNPLPQLVAEPTDARSNSFVGTHEYLAPEIIKGEGHGSAVDWWTFGIFLYELLYGKTPFKGLGNEETLANVVSHSLRFPEIPAVSFHARDLIRGLLKKEPENRLGCVKGAAEIKQHPFFDGLNWALIRCAVPPELPKFFDSGNVAPDLFLQNKESTKCQQGFKSTGEDLEFEIF